jgi:hypothetical protein
MNMQMALRRNPGAHAPPLRSWRLLQWLACAVVAAWTLHMFSPSPDGADALDAQTIAPVQPLVHWKDSGHDWLLVVDRGTRELVVYDANDGRPLRRMGVASGAGPIDSIVGEGDWLIATSRQDPHLQIFSLPGLQPAPLAGR